MKRRLIVTAVCSSAFILVAWFLVVDISWFIDDCSTCGYMRHVNQYRVFTIPIHENREDRLTILQRVLADVGMECRHPQIRRWHKHRYWGLVLCKCPCINGMYDIVTDDSWYDDSTSAKVKDFVSANPDVREEFAEKIVQNHDFKYLHEFLKRADVVHDAND